MHEIITLQLGQRSNYLATHFWNLQESYFTYNEEEESPVNHDVHFRPGIGADGTETFTPRTIIYDLKGGFGSLRKYNALYELEDPDVPRSLWDGKEVVHREPEIPQSEYQKCLDQGLPPPPLSSETVRYWSDFNRVFYHPRSIVQLNDYELNSKLMPFEDWSIGEELFRDLDKEHDLLDRDVRPFAEECDQIRALQIFTGSDDAWGGFAARYVDRLRDEYAKTGIWVWALEDGAKVQRQKQVLRTVNLARSIYAIAPQSSIFIPIVDPPHPLPSYVNIEPQSEWYTSSLIISAVETVTLPSRLRGYHDLEAALAGDSGVRKIFELQSSVIPDKDSRPEQPLGPEKPGPKKEVKEEDEPEAEFDLNLTDNERTGNKPHIFNQVEVLRGLEPEKKDEPWFAEDPGLARKRRRLELGSIFERFHTPLRFPIIDSYPRNLFSTCDPEAGIKIHAALTASSRVADRMKALQTLVGRVVAVEEREALTNGLGEIRESYEEGWMSDSDSWDD
ncbi:tubulin domain-containing protein [Thermoascus aurantiacus ATCC 26904]